MKNKFTKKHKHVLITKGTQGMAKLSLAAVSGYFSLFISHLISSAPCARMLSFFSGLFSSVTRPKVCSTSCARALSLLGIFVLIAGTMVFTTNTAPATAATSNQLNFQGRLLTASGDLVPDGNYHIEFKLYNASAVDGGETLIQGSCTTNPGAVADEDCLWTETRSTGDLVSIQNGYYSVYLGDVTALPNIDWSQDLYLGMNIGGSAGSASWDGEMTPRFKLTAVPYAFRASNVASSSTNAASTNSDGVSITTGNALGATSNSGNISVDTGTATGTTGTISLGSSNASALFLGRTGITTTNNGALTVTQQLTANGNLTIAGGTDFGVYYRDGSDNVVTTAAGATGECFRGTTGAAPIWGSCAGTGDIVQNGNSFTAAMTIGTNDAYDLNLETSGSTRITVSATGTTTFNGPVVLAASQSLTVTGGNTASRPASPTEGMIYFDSDTDSLLTYANGKWQSDRGEFVVVAASDSSQAEKDSADYVADGTADQTEINSALTAGAGGKVILLAGTYVADATILIPNNTTLAGTGRGTLIQLADIDATDNLIENSDTTTGTGVVIRDIRLDGQDTLNTAGTQRGIELNGMGNGNGSGSRQGGQIINVYVNEFRSTGLYITDSSNNIINGNSFVGNTSGVVLVGDSQNNTINSNISTGNSQMGIEIWSEYNLISGNTANSNGITGIRIIDYGNNTIVGNTTNGNGYGIQVGFSNNVITGNTSNNNDTGMAVEGDYVTISDNVITNNITTGISFAGSNLTITGNTVSGSDSGIVALYVDNSSISNNSLANNTAHGIYMSNGNNNVVTGNSIKNSGDTTNNNGINIEDSDFISITSNTITDSACTVDCYAINIFDALSDKNYLSGNRFTGSLANAASINDAGTNTIYEGQQVNSTTSTNSDVSDIRFRGSANSTTAFSVQNASGASILNVDTTNGEVELGNASTAGKLVVSDGSSNTVTLIATATAGDYTLSIPTLTANDTICVSGLNNCGYIASALTDNITDALDLQEGTNNYININTTNASENISFGNATTNPSYSFLGSGTTTFSGLAQANGKLYVNTATTADSLAQALISTGGTGNKGLVIQGVAGQTANIFEVQTSTGSILAGVTTSGNIFSNTLVQAASYQITSSSNIAGYISKQIVAGTGGVALNDVVVYANDGGNARVINTTTARDIRVYGVVVVGGAMGSNPTIAISGNFQVTADTGAVAIGDQLVTSTTSGQVMVDNNATTGILGVATTAKAGGASGLVGVSIRPVSGVVNPNLQAGNITTTGTITSGLINGQTINTSANFTGSLTVAGLTTLNGGLTVETGDTFTFNGDAFTDLTGGGLVNTGGVLTVDTTSATGSFVNGGNSFAGTATLGTNDANILSLETTNTSRFQIAAASATLTGQGATTLTSTGALTIDAATALNLGTTNATSLSIGRTGVTTTNNGALTVSELLTGNLGATISGATTSINASSNFNTNINTGTSTGAVNIGNSLSGLITLNSGAGTVVDYSLTASAAARLYGNTLVGDATTDRLTVTSQILGGSPLVFQGATDDGFTTTLAVIDPTANNTITLPDASGTVQLAPSSGSFIKQVPASTAENTITPTANSVVGLTVNGTIGTATTALAVSQPGASAGITIASANNTATNGLSFSGTFTNYISATNLTVTNAGNADFAGTLTAGTADAFQVNATGAVTAVGVNSGAGLLQGQLGLTITGAASSLSGGTISLNASSNNATNINTGTSTGAVAIGNSLAGVITLQSASTIGLTGTSTVTGLSAGAGTALTVNNSTSTGNILVAQDNGTTVFTVADGGEATFKTLFGTSNAFKVVNSADQSLFRVDSDDSDIVIGDGTINSVDLVVNGEVGINVIGATDNALTVNNGVSTGSIFIAQDNGTPVFTIADGGAVTATQLVTLNGGLTVEAGDTFTFNGDAFTDLTGAGLVVSSNALTLDITSATGAFINGGNSFTGIATLGTNDANSLVLETNNQSALTIANGGAATFKNNADSTGALSVLTSANARVFGVDTSNRWINFGEASLVTGRTVFYGDSSANDIMLRGQDAPTANRTIYLPDENGTICLQGSTSCGYALTSLTDNITDALDLQEGTNNYININTTNTSENISFGNATTNPSYNFLGSGTSTFSGALTVTDVTTLNGNTTIGNATTDRLTVTSYILGANALVFEGATDGNGFATTLQVTDPTANNTIVLPDASGTVLLAPAGSGNALVQVPTSNSAGVAGANIISPTAASIVGLTVNGTSNPTAATALAVVQSGASTGLTVTSSSTGNGQTISLTNTSGTQTAGLAVTRNGAGGTTTSLLDLTNTAGTVTSAIKITGTYSNLLSAPNISISNAGVITLAGSASASITTSAFATDGILIQPASSTGYTLNTSVKGGNFDTNGAPGTAGALVLNAGNAITSSGNIGNGGSVTIDAGTGINGGGSGDISIGTTTGINLTIGNTTETTGISLRGSSTASFTIGSSNTIGTTTLGYSTATNIVNIGSGNSAASATQTVNVGNGVLTNAASNITVNVLSGSAGTNGTATLNLANNDRVTAINIGNVAADAARTINLGTGSNTAAADTINIGTGTPSGSGTKVVTIGSNANVASTTSILGGSGTAAIALTPQTTGTIVIGAAAGTGNITLGSSSGSQTVLIGNGAGTATVNIGNASASAVVSIGAAMTTGTISIGGTGAQTGTISLGTGTGVQTINLGTGAAAKTINLGTTTAGSSLSLNSDGAIAVNSQALTFSTGGARSITLAQAPGSTNGYNLTVSAGGGGSGGTATTGGVLTLQGGAAGQANANGGNVVVAGGTGVGTGVKGLVVIDTATYSAATVQNFTANANITQASIDTYGSILISGNVAGWIATLTDPTITTAGRVIYVTNSGSVDITLGANTVGVALAITLKPGSTATMYWNGVDWTAAGASSSTDLQAAYDNTATSAGGAEIVLSSAGTGGLTIRNDDGTAITGGLLEVQSSIGSNLFTVNNNSTEYANNGGAESSTFTMWTTAPTAGGTITRYTTTGDNIATGAGSVFVDSSSTANTGVRNTLTSTLTRNLKYRVSFAIRHTSSSTPFSTLDVRYSPSGTNTDVEDCSTGNTVNYGQWTRITCTFIYDNATTPTSSNAILVTHSDAVDHDYYIDNFSTTVSADVNHAVDGSVDSALGTNWVAIGGSVARSTSVLYDTSGSVAATTSGTAGRGVYNNLTAGIVPQVSTQYRVAFYARGDGTNTATLAVAYTPDNNATSVSCTDYSTQVVSATAYTLVTCLLTTSATAPAVSQQLRITQTAGSATIFYIDALTMTLNTNNANNVQIGGANKGGPVTLFTLDRSAGAPIAANNDAYLGSMYYDTTTGRIQCYEADGWGACGAAPDNIVNLNPEYAGAVLNGTGVGTMTADFCSNEVGVLVAPTTGNICATHEARNFYKWTSPQATSQTYSIFVTYQLPATFNGFSNDDTVQLTARVDSTSNAEVTYEMFKSTGSAVTQCGTGETDVIAGGGNTADVWHTYGVNGNEATGCSFNSSSAGNFVIFKINMKAQSGANAYVSTLNFVTTGR